MIDIDLAHVGPNEATLTWTTSSQDPLALKHLQLIGNPKEMLPSVLLGSKVERLVSPSDEEVLGEELYTAHRHFRAPTLETKAELVLEKEGRLLEA